jgi:hypothetical protein
MRAMWLMDRYKKYFSDAEVVKELHNSGAGRTAQSLFPIANASRQLIFLMISVIMSGKITLYL